MHTSGYGPQRHSSHHPQRSTAAYASDPRYNAGYHPQHYAPPQGADPQLWQWFTNVDTDRSGAISVSELQSALVNGMLAVTWFFPPQLSISNRRLDK